MRYAKTVRARFAAMAALAVAALPLCASIPRGYMGNGILRHVWGGRTLLAVADADGARDRLVKRESGVGNRESSFSYDAVRNLLTASNSTATLAFGYDIMDRLASATTTVSGVSFVASYSRDAGGLVTNLVFGRAGSPNPPSVTRTYDPDGRLTAVSDWLGHTWTFAWDGAGKPTGGAAPGGILSTNHYDAAGGCTARGLSGPVPGEGPCVTEPV